MATRAARRLGWVVLVLIGIALGVLLGTRILPPGGPDPRIEPTPSALVASTVHGPGGAPPAVLQ